MQILSYGFRNPENGDRGSIWFPALNFNIVQLNGHTHDGVNSAQINAGAIAAGTVSIPAASWISDVPGRYYQDVTVPAGFNMSSYSIQVYLTSSQNRILPTINKLTTSTFRIYTIDNTLDYTAVFR